MMTQTIKISQLRPSESYQMIKGENLQDVVVSQQVLAGSKVALCEYGRVVFSEVEFYACEFQGVTFENCIFENCRFNFSHMRTCKFVNCSFVDCEMNSSSQINCIYESASELKDHTTDIYIQMLAA